MTKLDPRLVAGSYFTALALGVVEEPKKMTFLSKEEADTIANGIEEQIRRRDEIKKSIKEVLSVLSDVGEAQDGKHGG